MHGGILQSFERAFEITLQIEAHLVLFLEPLNRGQGLIADPAVDNAHRIAAFCQQALEGAGAVGAVR